MEIIKTLTSSSKKKGVIHFYEDFISFQLKSDHAVRKLFYSEMETVLIHNKGKWLAPIFLIFSLLFLIASLYFYLFQQENVLNVVSGMLLVLLALANWSATHYRLIQVKKGSLLIDIFYSNKRQEVITVFEWLQQKLEEKR